MDFQSQIGTFGVLVYDYENPFLEIIFWGAEQNFKNVPNAKSFALSDTTRQKKRLVEYRL